MSTNPADFLIVGSGAGGATLARELVRYGRRVTVLEKGAREEHVGTFRDCLRYVDTVTIAHVPPRSAEGVILWRAWMAGGTTMISCANMVPSLESELAALGVDLSADFAEAERDLGIAPTAERLLSEGAQTLWAAASRLGYSFAPMPKAMRPDRCQRCGSCELGCAHGAKWTALDYLDDAIAAGADFHSRTEVRSILIENGRVVGVRARGPHGEDEFRAGTVILAAGALATPRLLQQVDVSEAGQGLYMDLFVNVYGVTRETGMTREPMMSLVDLEFHTARGFLLSPYINATPAVRMLEGGPGCMALPTRRLLGLMVKTTDDPAGQVRPDGSVSKPVTEADRARLDEGIGHARRILAEAGADERSFRISDVQGAHPGGTAAIGRVVGSDLQTRIPGLYVCDASVLPAAPGLPPMLTIIALARRLGRVLTA